MMHTQANWTAALLAIPITIALALDISRAAVRARLENATRKIERAQKEQAA